MLWKREKSVLQNFQHSLCNRSFCAEVKTMGCDCDGAGGGCCCHGHDHAAEIEHWHCLRLRPLLLSREEDSDAEMKTCSQDDGSHRQWQCYPPTTLAQVASTLSYSMLCVCYKSGYLHDAKRNHVNRWNADGPVELKSWDDSSSWPKEEEESGTT